MLKANPWGDFPQVHESAFVDETAVIIGKVTIGAYVFVGPGAVIRADEPGSSIAIQAYCNVQDRVVIHALEKSAVEIGESTSLSHGCLVHGPCKIGKNCFIGFGSVVFGAEIDDGVIIKHLAVVEGVRISPQKVVESRQVIRSEDQVMILRHAEPKLRDFARKVIESNLILLKGYMKKTNP